MGAATVQSDANGQPCFVIENTVATRNGQPMLESVAVSTEGAAQAPSRVVWSFMIEPRGLGLSLSNGLCVPYGQVPAGMRLLTEPSALQPGVLYVVSMGVRLTDPNDPTQAYQGKFCLIPDSPRPRVHQVLWDAKAGKWQRDVCFSADASKR